MLVRVTEGIEMEIIYKKTEELKEYENNPRNNEEAVDYVANSIKEFGFKNPIILSKDNVIIAGHTRLKAAKKLGIKEVPCIMADDLTDEQVKAFRLADNKVGEIAEWDLELLDLELIDIDLDMTEFGFEFEEEEEEQEDETERYSLSDIYGIPPFTIIDGRTKDFQEKTRQWKDIGIKSELGRDENIMKAPDKKSEYVKGNTEGNAVKTSVFNPFLCQIMYNWFNVEGGEILDCFAGGSVRGVVAEKLGYAYTGIDLRKEQIDANIKNCKEIGVQPTYICGDSREMESMLPSDKKYDMIFSCPPYADLEVYSNDERDISNMDYKDFLCAYEEIIAKTFDYLKDDRFAVFVVGEVRSKKGNFYNFVSDTINAFIKAGYKYYNELIYITPNGTAGMRCKRIFGSYRKNVKTHQNILVFYKGDIKNIKDTYKDIEFTDIESFDY